MKLHDVTCNICSTKDRKLIFEVERYNIIFKIQQCLNCGLVYLNPRPDSESIEKYYASMYDYDAFLRNSEQIRESDEKEIKFIKRYRQSGNLLEIGCMYGFFLDEARKKGFNTYGVEISQKATEYARKNLGLNVYCGQLENNSFPGRFFDIVFLSHLIEHLEDPKMSLKIISRIIKDDGVLIIKCPNFNSLMSRINRKNWWWIAPPEHLYHFTAKTIKTLLDKTGFSQIEIQTQQGDLGYLRYLSVLLVDFLPIPKRWKVYYRVRIDNQPQHVSQKILLRTYNLVRPIIGLIHKFNMGEEMIVIARK